MRPGPKSARFSQTGWLAASVGKAYALLPQGLRIGAAYSAFRGELAAAKDRVDAWRLARRKLEDTLRWAIETVPAWANQRSNRSVQAP